MGYNSTVQWGTIVGHDFSWRCSSMWFRIAPKCFKESKIFKMATSLYRKMAINPLSSYSNHSWLKLIELYGQFSDQRSYKYFQLLHWYAYEIWTTWSFSSCLWGKKLGQHYQRSHIQCSMIWRAAFHFKFLELGRFILENVFPNNESKPQKVTVSTLHCAQKHTGR